MQDINKAIILAGGRGTRLYPVTKEIPKPLLPIKKKPIINYLVDLFLKYNVKEIAVLVSSDSKEDFVWWKKRHYPEQNIKIVAEEEEFGTFGGLYLLKEWIGDSDFFLTNGDELKDINLKEMINLHNKAGNPATIALVEVEDPEHYGVVICENNRVKEFLEKPESPSTKYINSGLYILSPEVFKYHQGLKFQMVEKDLFPQLAQENKLTGFKFNGAWTDCGTWERYEQAISTWQKKC